MGVVTSRFSFRIERYKSSWGDWSRIASLNINTHPSFPSPIFCRTISGNIDGKKENAPETHGTRNGTHGDVGKVDMCVLNPAPWNPG
ncbi:hypothetical protein YC2023_108884 [Brassica napus]